MCPLSFLGSDTPILDVVLISDLTVSVDRFRLNLTGSYERKADIRHSYCSSPFQTRSGSSAHQTLAQLSVSESFEQLGFTAWGKETKTDSPVPSFIHSLHEAINSTREG